MPFTPGMFDSLLVFAGLMALLGVVSRVVLAGLRRPRKGADLALARQLEEISARLSHLEHTADATALEVERIGEAHRFLAKALGERSSASNAPRS